MRRFVAFVAIAGCHGGGTGESGAPGGAAIDVPADRPVLSFTESSATDADSAQLPASFPGIQETVCAQDPSRQYIGEIVTSGVSDLEVDWHWAPVIPGPDPSLPTLNQPEWSVAGEVAGTNDSTDDVLADHPFGLDFNFDLELDPPFRYFGYNSEDECPSLHCELEIGAIPRAEFGFTPATGMRALARGVWVLDCGHPPYGAEMHPPTWLAFAGAVDAKTTTALTLVPPYRSSLLFSPTPDAADSFDDVARFSAVDTLPFEAAFVEAALRASAGQADRLTAHALMVANHFDPVDFLVCAPLPRPSGATLDASWHFTARTGVSVTAYADEKSGCVRVQASMSDAYVPKPLPHKDADWDWDELNAAASGQYGAQIDVRTEIIALLDSLGLPSDVPALQVENPPLIDAYDPLHADPGADADGPPAVVTSDAQPFPFYGRVRAAWK